jgi:hypothetical protein
MSMAMATTSLTILMPGISEVVAIHSAVKLAVGVKSAKESVIEWGHRWPERD